ncbi:hypothetical protein AOLI_G00257980 [Acnodon oligacanthus]
MASTEIESQTCTSWFISGILLGRAKLRKQSLAGIIAASPPETEIEHGNRWLKINFGPSDWSVRQAATTITARLRDESVGKDKRMKRMRATDGDIKRDKGRDRGRHRQQRGR